MREYIRNDPAEIVETAMRCLTKLSKDNSGNTVLFSEASKDDTSLKEKVIRAIDSASEAIENLGKNSKKEVSQKENYLNSWKDVPNEQVEVKDYKKHKTIISNTKKKLEKAYDEGADETVIDKIMKEYREHTARSIAITAVVLVALPALLKGIVEGFNSAINESTSSADRFRNKVRKDVQSGKMNTNLGSAYVRANTELTRDEMDAAKREFRDSFSAIEKIRERKK